MGTVLKNILNFTGLVVGVPVATPHLLNVNGVAKVPRIGGTNASGFTVTANATNVTITRTADAASGDARVYVEFWHSLEDIEPPGGIPAGYFPFFFAVGSSGGGGGIPSQPVQTFVYRPGGVAVDNVYTTWPTVYAAISTCQGIRTLEWDNTLGPFVVPAGVYDMTDVQWIGVTNRRALLALDGTATFPNLRYISLMEIEWSGSAPITSDFGDFHTLIIEHCRFTDVGSSGEMFATSGTGGSTYFVADDFEGNVRLWNVTASDNLYVDARAGQSGNLTDQCFHGAGFIDISQDQTNTVTSQPNFLGVISWSTRSPNISVTPFYQDANFNVDVGRINLVDTTLGAIVATLFDQAGNASPGSTVIIKIVAGGNNVTITPSGGDLINGAANLVLTPVVGIARLVAGGLIAGQTNWWTI